VCFVVFPGLGRHFWICVTYSHNLHFHLGPLVDAFIQYNNWSEKEKQYIAIGTVMMFIEN
jgi:hypothetical protein